MSLQVLLSHGADVNAVTITDRLTALHYAANTGHTVSLQVLWSHEADVNAVENSGVTALHLAANHGHTESLKVLLSHGADVNAKNENGITALHSSVSSASITSVTALLNDSNIDPKIPDFHKSTALLIAAEGGLTEIFELLLEKYDESDRSQQVDNDGTNLLQAAAYSGNRHLVQLVLRRFDCDINYVDKNGDSAIAYAALKSHAGAVEILLMEGGIDIDIVNNEGKTAFDIAKERNDEPVMALLRNKENRKEA
jgi:ankyrin repeat protein